MALCALWFAIAAMAADPAGPTPYPVRAQDYPGQGAAWNFPWMVSHRESFWAQRQAKKGAVVFAGDSLTAGWTTLEADFPRLLVANRGIPGDTSRGLLFRLREDVLDLAPKALVLLIGTNDLSARQEPRVTVANVSQMIEEVRAARPAMPIVLCTLPPRDAPGAPIDLAQLQALNAALIAAARPWKQVSVLDLHRALSQPDGAVDPRYLVEDRLHLSREGYRRWHAVLAERFTQIGLQE